jgi:hypothetical protein
LGALSIRQSPADGRAIAFAISEGFQLVTLKRIRIFVGVDGIGGVQEMSSIGVPLVAVVTSILLFWAGWWEYYRGLKVIESPARFTTTGSPKESIRQIIMAISTAFIICLSAVWLLLIHISELQRHEYPSWLHHVSVSGFILTWLTWHAWAWRYRRLYRNRDKTEIGQ